MPAGAAPPVRRVPVRRVVRPSGRVSDRGRRRSDAAAPSAIGHRPSRPTASSSTYDDVDERHGDG